MAIKFSQFNESASTAAVDFLVGYDGTDNVKISPSNLLGDYLPLSGGTLTGNLIISGSNGIYLGGVGNNNKLNDYEVGVHYPTWNANWSTDPSNELYYVKIGNVVHCRCAFELDNSNSTSTNYLRFSIPFQPGTNYYPQYIPIAPYDWLGTLPTNPVSFSLVQDGNSNQMYFQATNAAGDTEPLTIASYNGQYFTGYFTFSYLIF